MQPDAGGGMRVFEQTARAALRPFVERFLVVEFPSLHHDAHLPDVRSVAAFSLRGRVHINGHGWAAKAAFTGPRETLYAHEHRDHNAVLLATFTPAGAGAFLGVPVSECSGTTVDLGDVLGRPGDLDRLHEQLAGARNNGHRVKLLEDFMLGRVRSRSLTLDPLVAAAVDWLEQPTGPRRIDDLTRYIGLSHSALERRFRRVVGTSPRTFLTVIRLQRAAKALATGGTLTMAAHDAGYFDQSHFIHDFRRATGASPRAFFRRTSAA